MREEPGDKPEHTRPPHFSTWRDTPGQSSLIPHADKAIATAALNNLISRIYSLGLKEMIALTRVGLLN